MSPNLAEALSVKYNCCRIVRLSSGAYAVFHPYNPSGLPLAHIGTGEEALSFVLSPDEVDAAHSAFSKATVAAKRKADADIRAALGLDRPVPTITRRKL